MQDTKKLTTGAMLLAIVGALMVANRFLALAFDELIFLIFSEIIIIYSCLYGFKAVWMMVAGIVALTLLLGTLTTYIYMPLGIIGGLVYAYMINKDADRTRLLFMEIGAFVLGELLITFLVLPIFGVDFQAAIQLVIEQTKTNFATSPVLGIMEGILDNIVATAYIMGVILVGVVEGLLVHLLAIFLLKRFKIKDIKAVNLYALKIHPAVAYVSMAMVFLIFVAFRFENQPLILYACITLALLGFIVLLALGYIFLVVYGNMVLGRNITIFIILIGLLLLPYSLIILLVIGFLYGAGPLRYYLDKKAGL